MVLPIDIFVLEVSYFKQYIYRICEQYSLSFEEIYTFDDGSFRGFLFKLELLIKMYEIRKCLLSGWCLLYGA